MSEKKYGLTNKRPVLTNPEWYCLFIRRHEDCREEPVIRAGQSMEWNFKAGTILYGLREMIGKDSLTKALMEFKSTYAFRNTGPFTGADDLYNALKKHTPDSLQYYLTDPWQKVTLYDNMIKSASVKPTGNKDEYLVNIDFATAKTYTDKKGDDVPTAAMNDYIDIGVFGQETTDKSGLTQQHLIYQKRYKFTKGDHYLSLRVKGKPKAVAIDPLGYLIDHKPTDNVKDL